MAICKQSASSALIFMIALMQHIMLRSCLASPIATAVNPGDMDGSGNNVDVAPSTQRAFTFEDYPERQKLMDKTYTLGLPRYQKLQEGRTLTSLPAGVQKLCSDTTGSQGGNRVW